MRACECERLCDPVSLSFFAGATCSTRACRCVHRIAGQQQQQPVWSVRCVCVCVCVSRLCSPRVCLLRVEAKASPGCAVPFRRSATTATPPVSRYVVGRCIISKQKLQRAALPRGVGGSGRSIAAFTGSDVTPREALELQQSSKFRRVRCCDVGGSRRWPCIS